MSVPFRIRCCLCVRNIPLAGDAHLLDAEWHRRYPEMTGTIACDPCATRTPWTCTRRGVFVDGHIPSPNEGPDIDAWSHILRSGTHRAMVLINPRSGLLQGAEPYLRDVTARRGTPPENAARLRALLQEWDTATGSRPAAGVPFLDCGTRAGAA
ncbi:hypothetical protein [Streptomyces sp. NPDC014894]|uniref:hypothetical protein n=1 Tax=Streptomyces sp. NPDC014894 TaxID=3364931 RepID=UPI0036F6FED2